MEIEKMNDFISTIRTETIDEELEKSISTRLSILLMKST